MAIIFWNIWAFKYLYWLICFNDNSLYLDLQIEQSLRYVRFEVFTAVTMKNGVFWDVTPCGSCKSRRFGGTWRLLHQGDSLLLVFFLVHRFLSPWWRRRQVPPKRRFLQEPHGVPSQKTPLFKGYVTLSCGTSINKYVLIMAEPIAGLLKLKRQHRKTWRGVLNVSSPGNTSQVPSFIGPGLY
jgi:hypothetical protein